MSRRDRRLLRDTDPRRLEVDLWRRGRRAALLGLAIAVGVVTLLGGGLSLLLQAIEPEPSLTPVEAVSVLLRVVGLIAFGPATGLLIVNLTVLTQVTAVIGTGPAARRIQRAVLRKNAPALSVDDQQRAAVYAPLGAAAARFQVLTNGVFFCALLLQQVTPLLEQPSSDGFDLRPLSIVIGVLLLGTFAVLAPLLLRQAARATRYADIHPSPAAAAEPSGSPGAGRTAE